MSDKTLSPSQIQALLSRDHKPAKWPNDVDLEKIADAVSKNKDSVIFKDRKVYLIKYEERWDGVFVYPADGTYVPCGHFSHEKLRGILKHGAIG